MDTQELLERESFIELDARSRAKKLLDAGTFRELLDPFERVSSPWLARQGIVTQADDGTVVAKGEIDGQPAVDAEHDGGLPVDLALRDHGAVVGLRHDALACEPR